MYYKISTNNDWFIINANDLFRCLKMLNDENLTYKQQDWKSQIKEKNKFEEFSVKSYNEWLKTNND